MNPTKPLTMTATSQALTIDGLETVYDALATATLRKAVKNLTDAKAEFEKGGRTDLAINGSFWIGAAIGAAGSIVLIDPAQRVVLAGAFLVLQHLRHGDTL